MAKGRRGDFTTRASDGTVLHFTNAAARRRKQRQLKAETTRLTCSLCVCPCGSGPRNDGAMRNHYRTLMSHTDKAIFTRVLSIRREWLLQITAGTKTCEWRPVEYGFKLPARVMLQMSKTQSAHDEHAGHIVAIVTIESCERMAVPDFADRPYRYAFAPGSLYLLPQPFPCTGQAGAVGVVRSEVNMAANAQSIRLRTACSLSLSAR